MLVQSHLLEQYSHNVKIFKHYMNDVLCTEKLSCEKIADKYHQVIATISCIFDYNMKIVKNHCIYLE